MLMAGAVSNGKKKDLMVCTNRSMFELILLLASNTIRSSSCPSVPNACAHSHLPRTLPPARPLKYYYHTIPTPFHPHPPSMAQRPPFFVAVMVEERLSRLVAHTPRLAGLEQEEAVIGQTPVHPGLMFVYMCWGESVVCVSLRRKSEQLTALPFFL